MSELQAFKAITTFAQDLNDVFGEKHHAVKLYHRLIELTTFKHAKSIEKHVALFRDFCVANRDAILNKNFEEFTQERIEYSERAYIDFTDILADADRETRTAILQHLLTISAFVDPVGNAKMVLKAGKGNETDFLNNIMDKLTSTVNVESSNPMDIVSSVMSSGIFTEIMSGMDAGVKSGELDMGKLLGTVKSMCAALPTSSTDECDPMEMITALLAGQAGPPAARAGGVAPLQPPV